MSSSACLLNSTSSACLNSTNISALLTTSAIIGIAVGGFIFLLLILFCIICICCGCCACKNTFAQNGQRGVIYPNTFNEEPSVIMIQHRERFKPQYIPPHTQNPKPAFVHKPVPARNPEVTVTPQRPPQPRPISVRPISSHPPAEEISQVVDPPYYELPNNPEPVKEIPTPIYEPPPTEQPSQAIDPPYYELPYEPPPPAYNEFEQQPTNVVENIENFSYDQ